MRPREGNRQPEPDRRIAPDIKNLSMAMPDELEVLEEIARAIHPEP
jgi:hypothetical protein